VKDSTDRRVRRTRQQLISALMTLMKEKTINDISVRELAELADINRGTFYLHYRDPFDMLCKLEDELLEQFQLIVDQYRFDHPTEFFVKLYNCVESNHDFITILFNSGSNSTFWERLRRSMQTGFRNGTINHFGQVSPVRYDYYCAFAISGVTNMIRQWLENGMREPKREMASMSRDIILLSASILEK